jgi:hypothetical protein
MSQVQAVADAEKNLCKYIARTLSYTINLDYVTLEMTSTVAR